MLQGISNHHNAFSATVTRFASRFSSITPRNKAIIGSATVLTLFISVLTVAANNTSQNDYTQPAMQLNTDTTLEVNDNNIPLPEAVPGESKVETKVDVEANTSVDGDITSPSVEVEVNGQDIPVPEDGEFNQVVPGTDGSGNVQVNVHSNSTESEDRDNTRIQINAESESEVRIRTGN